MSERLPGLGSEGVPGLVLGLVLVLVLVLVLLGVGLVALLNLVALLLDRVAGGLVAGMLRV